MPCARYAIDVGCLVTHEALRERAKIRGADVVTPDHEDVRLLAVRRGCWLLRPCCCDRCRDSNSRSRGERSGAEQDAAAI